MTAYYNEIDSYAAQWLRNLIAAGHIAPGDVDERSIVDVRADDLRGYGQCHFFAGIGGWSYALRLAGWPNDRPVWTGSCPCQPFSAAGEGAGFEDERDLWPAWFELIRQRTPAIIFGEQVAAATVWLDRVFADLEDTDYAVAAAILPACAVDAPHRRDRLWFVADTSSERRQQIARGPHGHEGADEGWPTQDDNLANGTDQGSLADALRTERRPSPEGRSDEPDGQNPGRQETSGGHQFRGAGAVAHANGSHGFWWSGPLQVGRNAIEGQVAPSGDAARTQWRIGPGVSLLADGIPNRVAKLRGFGNAIVPQVAAEFIRAALR